MSTNETRLWAALAVIAAVLGPKLLELPNQWTLLVAAFLLIPLVIRYGTRLVSNVRSREKAASGRLYSALGKLADAAQFLLRHRPFSLAARALVALKPITGPGREIAVCAESDVSRALNQLDPFQRDKLFRTLRFRGFGPGWVAVIWVSIMAGTSIVNYFQGTLFHKDGAALLTLDALEIAFPFVEIAPDRAGFPLLRDSVTLLSLSLLSFNICVLYRQWELMQRLITDLIDNRVVRIVDVPAFNKAVERNNDRFRSGGKVWSVYGALILALIIQGVQNSQGIYWGLAPSNLRGDQLREWSLGSYDQWWASSANPIGFVAYTITVAILLYYAIAQNQVGVSVTRLFWEQRANLDLNINLLNPDGRWGWLPLRKLMRTVYIAVLVNMLVLLWFFQLLPPIFPLGTPAQISWALPWLATLLFLGPYYLFTPYLIVAPRLREVKSRLTSYVTTNLVDPSENPTDAARLRSFMLRTTALAQIRKVPIFPIHAGGVATFYVLVVFLSVTSIVSLFLAVRSP